MSLKVYAYEKCDTCRKALRYLGSRGVRYVAIPIREHPPTRSELKRMLKAVGGEVRRLFNTSGQEYRRLRVKDKLPAMSEREALALLGSNGNLVKRPFVLTPTGGAVGFDETEWEVLLK